MSQIERIAYIDRTLREHGAVKLRKVAARFEVSDRQVKRDIEYLRDRLDAPIVFDALRFADEKLLIFHALLRNIARNQHYMPVATSELLTTSERWISHDYRGIANRVSYAIPVSESMQDLEDFTIICQAMVSRRRLQVEYQNAKGEHSIRMLEAERLVNYSGRWYLIAHDLLHNELRTFHLARLRRVSITRERSAAESAAHRAAAEHYVASGFGIFNGPERARAVIRIHGGAAHLIARQQWHPDQEVHSDVDSAGVAYTDLTVPVSDWREILGRVLSFGATAEAIEPEEFRQLWRQEVRKMGELAGDDALSSVEGNV
jgi:predicted DNA-binding transcriptional regulator YafY